MQGCRNSIPGCGVRDLGLFYSVFIGILSYKVYFQIYAAWPHLSLDLFVMRGDEPSSRSYTFRRLLLDKQLNIDSERMLEILA